MVSREPFQFGELRIDFDGDVPVIHGPASEDGCERDLEPREDAIREWVREDELRRYRPLPTALTMRGGWRVRCEGGLSLEEALEVIYPLALRHTAMFEAGALRVVTLDEVFARQSGRYRGAARLSGQGREATKDVLCGRCAKSPLWDGEADAHGAIPCPEPCSLMLSICREAALWEAIEPTPAQPDPAVAWAAFDEPGNEIREAFLRERFAPAPTAGQSA